MASLLKRSHQNCPVKKGRRCFATTLYAIGEGWTGALGTGRFDQTILGHEDEDDGTVVDLPVKVALDKIPRLGSTPIIDSVAVGWGHTAFISNKKLFITGRPHDFSNLLRLRRLPRDFRDYAVRRSAQSTLQNGEYEDQGLDPTSLTGRLITYLSDSLLSNESLWEVARVGSIMAFPTEIQLPDNEIPTAVRCSAGLTAVISQTGNVYTFGLNVYGQCGIGTTSNNVWIPQRVVGLSADFANVPRAEMPQSFPIQDVKLGLQHAICLNTQGEIFSFGKGDRGQLGREPPVNDQSWAEPITKTIDIDRSSGTSTIAHHKMKRVQQIAAGMLHSAALDEDNNVFIWGKNLLPKVASEDSSRSASDARLPLRLRGLPENLQVLQLSCGSHHTAVLLEDGSIYAMGIASDTRNLMLEPVMIVEPGVLELPVRQFECHMDRTTIVSQDGQQVLQVHLWEDPELQDDAIFTPLWFDRLLEEDWQTKVSSVHRSWIHSIIAVD